MEYHSKIKRNLIKLSLVLLTGINLYGRIENPNFEAGFAYYKQNKFLQSIGSFKKAIDEGFRNPLVYYYLGNAYQNLDSDEYDKALDNYLLAYELSDSAKFKAIVMYNMGTAASHKKDFTNSLKYMNQAFRLDTNLVNVFWAKGIIYFRMRDKQNTIKAWETYLKLSPNGPQSEKIRIALAILKQDDYEFPPTSEDTIPGQEGNSSKDSGKDGGATDIELIDIEGVLENVNPEDKGKVEDEEYEGLEM